MKEVNFGPMTFTGTARVILFANKKGGVGKSTVAASVAHMIAIGGRRGGRKVLVIDGDPQATLTEADYGIENGDDGASLSKTLQFGDLLVPVRGVRPNLDVIAGGSMVTGLARKATHATAMAANLQTSLETLCAQEGYEVVIIDSAPGWIEEILLDVFLQVANYLVIPTKSDVGSMKPMRALAEQFFTARAAGASIQLLGVVLFAPDARAPRRTNETFSKIAELLGDSGIEPFGVPIRYNEAASIDLRDHSVTIPELAQLVSETKSATLRKLRSGEDPGRPLWTGSNIAELVGDFQELVYELISRIARYEAQDQPVAAVGSAR